MDVQGHGNDVRQQDKTDASWPIRKCEPYDAVAKPEPVAYHESELSGSNPGCHATFRPGRSKEVMKREYVEVEARHTHDRIVGIVLVGHCKVGDLIPHKSEVVVGGMNRFEERRTCGEEWYVLEVRIVLLYDH